MITHEEARDVLVREAKMVWNESEFAEAYISQQEKKDELLELYENYRLAVINYLQTHNTGNMIQYAIDIDNLKKELGEMK